MSDIVCICGSTRFKAEIKKRIQAVADANGKVVEFVNRLQAARIKFKKCKHVSDIAIDFHKLDAACLEPADLSPHALNRIQKRANRKFKKSKRQYR